MTASACDAAVNPESGIEKLGIVLAPVGDVVGCDGVVVFGVVVPCINWRI